MNLTKREVAEAVASQFPMRIIYEDVADDPDQRNYEVSFERIRRAGFRAAVPLETSLAEIGAAARLNSGEAMWRFRP